MYETLSSLIQTSLSPVFLLSAIGVTLSVIDTRQNRIVDRVRAIEHDVALSPQSAADRQDEVLFYIERARRIGRSAALCILSALSVAVVVVMLLVDAQTRISLSLIVEGLFTTAVLLYWLSLVLFLRDLFEVNRGLGFVVRRISPAVPKSQGRPE